MNKITDVESLAEEREVTRSVGVAFDGAPIAQVAMLAAVVVVLTIVPIPFTAVFGTGRNFPMGQVVYPLVGWLLGPLAGALVDGFGALIGVLINPQNSSSLIATVIGAAFGGLAAGAMADTGPRRKWWMPLALVFIGFYALYAARAVLFNRLDAGIFLLATFINWSALLLFLSPARVFFARSLRAPDTLHLALGLFGGTWMVAGLTHLCTGTIVYWITNWANKWWPAVAAAAPLEHTVRALLGAVIGLGVISGLRSLKLFKPPHSVY